MTEKSLTPAQRIIARFGVETLARWTGRHRTRVHAWTWPSARGGTGGAIPIKVRQRIIEGARQDLGVTVEYREFEPRTGEVYLEVEGVA